MPISETLLPWLPALLTAALSAVALSAEAVPATTSAAKRLRLTAIAILGLLALATTVWQGWAAGAEIARIRRDDQSKELATRVKALEEQLVKLKESTRGRSLGGETAAKLADYLRPSGSRSIVVSCTPNDIEAYHYATEIADALKSAHWDARGPQTTMIFGNIQAMGVNVFDNGGPGSDTAKILMDAFAKFDIPYQTRVPPSEALASGTVELFIGAKPGESAMTRVGTAH